MKTEQHEYVAIAMGSAMGGTYLHGGSPNDGPLLFTRQADAESLIDRMPRSWHVIGPVRVRVTIEEIEASE